MSAYHEPEVVQLARRVVERSDFTPGGMRRDDEDSMRLAQYVLADWDQRAIARMIDAERRLEIRVSISEAELVLAKHPESVIENALDQMRRVLMSKSVMMRERGRLSKALFGQEPGR